MLQRNARELQVVFYKKHVHVLRLNRATGQITTFYITGAAELARKTPSLGWTP